MNIKDTKDFVTGLPYADKIPKPDSRNLKKLGNQSPLGAHYKLSELVSGLGEEFWRRYYQLIKKEERDRQRRRHLERMEDLIAKRIQRKEKRIRKNLQTLFEQVDNFLFKVSICLSTIF